MRLPIVLIVPLLALTAAPAQREPFASQVLKVSGMGPGPGAQIDPEEEIDAGEIWVTDLNAHVTTRVAQGSFRSPVFTPAADAIMAVRDDTIVRIPLGGGAPDELFQLDGLAKIIGFSPDGKLLVQGDDGSDTPQVGLLTVAEKKLRWLSIDPAAAEDKAALDRIRGWERSYGAARVFVRKETSNGRNSTQVYLEEPGKDAMNASQCEKASCGQPSMAPEKRLVVYIRAQ